MMGALRAHIVSSASGAVTSLGRRLTGVLRSVSSAYVVKTGRMRRASHRKKGHQVLTSTMRDMKVRGGEFEFYFRPSWYCLTCSLHWPQR